MMLLLNEKNEVIDTNAISASGHKDLHFSVYDFNKLKGAIPDFYFIKGNTEWVEFSCGAAVLEVAGFQVILPFKNSVLVSHNSIAEAVAIEDLSGRDFEAFVFNPLSSFKPRYEPIRFQHGIKDHTFIMPVLTPTQLLTVPIGYDHSDMARKTGALCLYTCEKNSKMPDSIDCSTLW